MVFLQLKHLETCGDHHFKVPTIPFLYFFFLFPQDWISLSLTTMKNHFLTCRSLSAISPSLKPQVPFSSKSSLSPSPEHFFFTSINHFHKKLEKV